MEMIPSSRVLLTVHIKKLPNGGEGVNDSQIYGLSFIVNSLSVVLVLMFEEFFAAGPCVRARRLYEYNAIPSWFSPTQLEGGSDAEHLELNRILSYSLFGTHHRR
jgi:hypothetical protein